ncbi:MAG: hypothetical protein ACPG05_02505 [Bdellovibrionales bacterium]
MNIWLFAWVVIAVFIIGVFFWSMQILFQQKKAWKRLAKSLGLEYSEQALFKSPVVEGQYKGYSVVLYSEEQPTTNAGRNQFRTILLLGFQEGFPTGIAVASSGRRAFIESLKVEHAHKPDFKDWNGSTVFHTEDDDVCTKFMNADRYGALHKLMNLKNKDTILIVDDKEGYYRIETTDPLLDVDVVEKMLNKFTATCDVIRPVAADKKLFPKKDSKSS